MKHHTKLILLGVFTIFSYFSILGSTLIADKFAWKIIGLFVIPLGLSLIVIGFIERHYKGKKIPEDQSDPES